MAFPEYPVRTLGGVETGGRGVPSRSWSANGGKALLPAATRLDVADIAVGIRRELLLVPFELSPVDIALMVILEDDLPVFERLSMPVSLLRPPVDDRRAMLALPVDIGASIERVLEDRNDIAIANRRPVEGDHSLTVGRPRKMELIRPQRQQNLPRAAQLAEPREDETDRSCSRRSGSNPR